MPSWIEGPHLWSGSIARGAAPWIAALALASCDPGPPAPAGPSVTVAVAALDLPGVGDVVWDLELRNGAAEPQVVWQRRVTSSGYGNGSGSAAYVGPCDADASPNTLRVWLVGLYDAPVSAASAGAFAAGSAAAITATALEVDSPTAAGPLTRTVACVANADNAVQIDVTVARPATQGFFDVALAFNDLFCSAKFDCCTPTAGGGCAETALLFDADGARGTTYVLGFACTAGTESAVRTTLLLDDLAFDCDLQSNASTFLADFTVDPSGAPGNQCTPGADGLSSCLAVHDDPPAVDADAYLFQVAVFKGAEALAGTGGSVHKVYWNVALGVRPGIAACRLRAAGTADDGADDADGVTAHASGDGGAVAAGVVYPWVAWDVPLGGCGQEPLTFGDPAATVRASYTDVRATSPTPFAHRFAADVQTRLAACTGLPAHAAWSGADTVLQTWDGAAWTPSDVGAFDPAPAAAGCYFLCETNHVWSGASCDPLPNPPSLATVFPDYGPLAGGATIALVGTNFAPGATVTFGGVPSPAVAFGSATRLDVEVPAGLADGTVALTVTNADSGTVTRASGYTYGPKLPIIACRKTGSFAAGANLVSALFTAGDCGGALPSTDTANPAYPPRPLARYGDIAGGIVMLRAGFSLANGPSTSAWRLSAGVSTAYDLRAVFVPRPSGLPCAKLYTPAGNATQGATTFAASDCGGVLPTADYVGVLANNEANYGVVGFAIFDAGAPGGPGSSFVSDTDTHGLGVYTAVTYVPRAEVIVCSRTQTVSGSSAVTITFTAANCGGALPSAQHVGALRTVLVGGGAYGYGVNGNSVWLRPKSSFSGSATVEAVYFLP